MNSNKPSSQNRRDFLKTSSTAIAGVGLAAPFVFSSEARAEINSDTLKIGLIGCGGRGTGAANQALTADKNAVLWSVGDVFPEQAEGALRNLKNEAPIADKINVTGERTFSGLDAFEKVIASGVDVVLLATPPGFRPQHLKAAVEAGKHVFCEKPMATDVPGLRSVMESSRLALKQKTALVAGFCWRYELGRREFYNMILDGALGDVRGIHATYLTGPVKPMPPASKRPSDMGDVEWQLRNWYNFTWLSGDGLVEQACHSVDKIAWAMRDVPPLRCTANGGRQVPNNEGNIYDHISVFYEWESGVRATMAQRQISGCANDNSDYLVCANGEGLIKGISAPQMTGAKRWKYRGETPNMYQVEHNELFASIRAGKVINDGEWMAKSTLMALMGRAAAYTGQEITWDEALNSNWKFVPDNLTWDMKLPIRPMAIPGQTKFM